MLILYYCAVEPRYNEVLEIVRIALYLVSHCVRAIKLRNIRCWEQWNCLVVRGLCYIRPLCSEVPLYYPSPACFFFAGEDFYKREYYCLFYVSSNRWNRICITCAPVILTVVTSIHLLYANV